MRMSVRSSGKIILEQKEFEKSFWGHSEFELFNYYYKWGFGSVSG
jgi:hypothetical protein